MFAGRQEKMVWDMIMKAVKKEGEVWWNGREWERGREADERKMREEQRDCEIYENFFGERLQRGKITTSKTENSKIKVKKISRWGKEKTRSKGGWPEKRSKALQVTGRRSWWISYLCTNPFRVPVLSHNFFHYILSLIPCLLDFRLTFIWFLFFLLLRFLLCCCVNLLHLSYCVLILSVLSICVSSNYVFCYILSFTDACFTWVCWTCLLYPYSFYPCLVSCLLTICFG